MRLASIFRSRVLFALPLCAGLSLTACGDDSSSTPDNTTKDSGNSTPKHDAGAPAKDASQLPPDDGDSGPTVPDSGLQTDPDASSGNPKLDALKGRYLMRLDVLGTATSTLPLGGGNLKIRSRLSTFVVAELSIKDGKLVSNERICTQVAEQKCLETCTKATTVVDQRTINNFLLKRNQTREWTLDGDTLTAGKSVAQLGYDDPDLEIAPPDKNTDERVWDVDPSTPAREGFLTSVVVSVGLPIMCEAFGTQKYVSSFTAKVGSDGKFSYDPMNLDLDGSDAKVLPTNDMTCDNQAKGAQTPIDKQQASLVRYGDELSEADFWACPKNAVFDQQLPPTEPGLTGP